MAKKSEKTLLEWALEYHRKGINVVKAYYKGKFPAKGGEWEIYETKRVTIDQLRKWFGPDVPYSNISAISGPISGGLTVLDFDSEKAYRWWAEQNQDLAAELPTSKSGRGYHIFFRSILTKDDVSTFNQIHIKAAGLVSLPPSMHKSGVRYEWIIPLPTKVADLPLIDPHKWDLNDFTDGKDGKDGKEGNDGNEGVSKKGFENFTPESQAAIEESIKRTLPTQYGQRYKLLFLFARILKNIDEIKNKSGEELLSIADRWHERALPNIRTKSWLMTRQRFINAWEDAKYPVGEGKSLDIAKAEAFKSTMPMPELDKYKGEEIVEKVVRLCFSLQKLAGPDDDWFIPIHKAQKLFGVSHSWLAVILEKLRKDKIIKKTRNHTEKKCARHKFIGPSISILRKEKNRTNDHEG